MQENVHDDIAARNKAKKIAKQVSTFLNSLGKGKDRDILQTGYSEKGHILHTVLRNNEGGTAMSYTLLLRLDKIVPMDEPFYLIITFKRYGVTAAYGRYDEFKAIYMNILDEAQWRSPTTMMSHVGPLFDLNTHAFVHEIIHYFDELRVDNMEGAIGDLTPFRKPQNPNEQELLMKQYYNNALEFNAHYQGIMNEVDKKIRRIPIKYRKEMFPNFEKFYFAIAHGISGEASIFFKHLDSKMEKHIRKRLYQYYQLKIGGPDMEEIKEKAVTANDELFFLDDNETKQSQTSFEEGKKILEQAVFLNGHLIEEGTLFRVVGR